MKISVIMVDGGFRENIFSAKYFLKQDFPEDEYEVIWVEYYNKAHEALYALENLKIIKLDKESIYHSSYCFNKGIEEANGELIVIPDADQIVEPDFLSRIYSVHKNYDKLATYIYRYDEIQKGALDNYSWKELNKKCKLKNPLNYGGCLIVKKKWLLKINGYEMHPIFKSGFHANGLDIYNRLKNLGLAVQWDRELKLYHPWHPSTRVAAPQYDSQKAIVDWRKKNLEYRAFVGINKNINYKPNKETQALLDYHEDLIDSYAQDLEVFD